MLRLKAIFRCLWHAVEPPWLERKLTGSCHYQTDECHWTWAEHAGANLKEAFKLALFLPVDGEFHGLGQ